jgi:carboxypeptidase T
MRSLIFLCSFFACLTLSSADAVLRVTNNAVNRGIMNELGFEYLSRNPEFIDIYWNKEAADRLSSFPDFEAGFLKNSRITDSDVEAQFAGFARSTDLGVYHTFAEMEAFLRDIAERYPQIARLHVVGRTHENNPVYALEMGRPGADKPTFLIIGGHHAREWISHEIPIALIESLTSGYEKDQEATEILDSCTVVVVPMLNVDGAIYSQTVSPMWRKNRRPTSGSAIGVDNNRNYAYKWGVSGASSWASADTYMGPEAMSEKENQIVRDLQEKYNFTASVSYHSYGELVLWPWSYTNRIVTKDNAAFEKMGREMAAIMGYKPIQSAELYPSAGDTDDFLYGEYGVFSFTIELGRRFVPQEEQVESINSKGVKMLRHLLVNGRDPFATIRNENLYGVKTTLEKIVRDVIEGGVPEGRVAHYEALSDITEADLLQAMRELRMTSSTRKRILTELGQFNRYREME